MLAYKANIPDSQLNHLQQLVGTPIADIFSPALEVHDEYIRAFSLSLTLERSKRFLDFHIKRLRTERATDYWQFFIVRSDSPRNLDWEVLDLENEKYEFAASSICLPQVWYVSKVEVYETKLSFLGDVIQYDSAIVIYQSAGRRLCISPAEFTTMLSLTLDDYQINELIRHQHRKLRWSSV